MFSRHGNMFLCGNKLRNANALKLKSTFIKCPRAAGQCHLVKEFA